jgi:HAD superfamily hydrolase (TIGR01490 family)
VGTPAALFDIDGTLTTTNVWRGLMDYFANRRERRLTHVAFVGLHYPLVALRPLGLLREATFRRLWSAHLPWYFRGYDAGQMKSLAEWVAQEYVSRVEREDVRALLDDHLIQAHVVALVSGAPQEIVAAVAAMWNVPHAVGSPAELMNGRYTGRMAGPPCIDEYKAQYVRDYFAQRGLEVDYAASYAYADSYSDLGLFALVGKPVAVCPLPAAAEWTARTGYAPASSMATVSGSWVGPRQAARSPDTAAPLFLEAEVGQGLPRFEGQEIGEQSIELAGLVEHGEVPRDIQGDGMEVVF